jgi:hypothetical protein
MNVCIKSPRYSVVELSIFSTYLIVFVCNINKHLHLKKDVLGERSEGRLLRFDSKTESEIRGSIPNIQPSCKYKGLFMDGLQNESRSPYTTISGRELKQQAES